MINKQIKFKLDDRYFIWYVAGWGRTTVSLLKGEKKIDFNAVAHQYRPCATVRQDDTQKTIYIKLWRPKQTKSTQSRVYVLYNSAYFKLQFYSSKNSSFLKVLAFMNWRELYSFSLLALLASLAIHQWNFLGNSCCYCMNRCMYAVFSWWCHNVLLNWIVVNRIAQWNLRKPHSSNTLNTFLKT